MPLKCYKHMKQSNVKKISFGSILKEMEEVERKLKFSAADSTVMLHVQQAMSKAYEKIKSRHGGLLRLNAISVFYEFAVLQLNICLSFVKKETGNSILESGHKEVLEDLREIRDRFHRRLEDTELAIVVKDREIHEIHAEVKCLANQKEGMSRSPWFAAKPSSDDGDVEGNEDRGKEHEVAVTAEDGGNHVAKLIKNHESIIKKKSEELVPPKLELTKRQKSNDSSRRVIDGIVARQESTKLYEDPRDVDRDEATGIRTLQEEKGEVINNGEEEGMESEKIEFGLTEDICRLVLDNAIECFSSCGNQMPQNCVYFLENDLKEDVNGVVFNETLREWKRCTERRCGDEDFRQEMLWILTQEFLRHVSEDAKNRTSELLERFEANSKRANEEERSRTHGLVQCCRRMSQVSEDLEFKIQEKLKMVNLRFGELNTKLHSTKNCIGSLRENECLYRKAFILRCENLRKAETEVDLLGDQVDSLVELLQNTLRTLDQHPQLQQNYSDISEISTTIKKKLLGDDSSTG